MKKNSVPISVIMSTYKTERKYLTEAIDSILKQTYDNFELVLVCDGDIDEYNFIKNHYKTHKIKLLINNKNMGLPYSLNRAIRESNGKYIARMDSDDIAHEKRLEKQVKYMETHNNIVLCATDAKTFGKYNKKLTSPYTKPNEIYTSLLYGNIIIHPTVMIRRDVLIDNKVYYNETFLRGQDYELWSRLKEYGDFSIIHKPYLRYRVHNKQSSIAKKNEQKESAKKTLKLNHQQLKTSINFRQFEKNIDIINNPNNTQNKDIIELSNFIQAMAENEKINKDVFIFRFFQESLKQKNIILNRTSLKLYLNPKNILYLSKYILNILT